jgi:hypothetical protein
VAHRVASCNIDARHTIGPPSVSQLAVRACRYHQGSRNDRKLAVSGKRRAQEQIALTVLLAWIIINLSMLVLLFADQSFSKATIELMCLF